jgi:hypothetical protein
MENEYTLDFLIETFKRHKEQYDKESEEIKEKCPDSPLLQDFNLPKALKTICEEIKLLKQKDDNFFRCAGKG